MSDEAAPRRVVVVAHPDAPLVLDRLGRAAGEPDEPSWPELLDVAAGLAPDGAWPLGPDRTTDAGTVYVVAAVTDRTAGGTTWVDDPPRDWPEPVRAAVRAHLDEDAPTVPAPQRPAWMRRGWWAEAADWADGVLAATGRPGRTAPLHPARVWSISAVARVDTTAGPCWLKAVSAHFAREPRAILALADSLAGARTDPPLPGLPEVLAWRDDGPAGARMLMADVGTVPDEVAPGDPVRLAAGLARLQAVTAPHLDRLRVDGALDDRSPGALAAGLARLVDDGLELDRLDPGERAVLRSGLPRWQDRLLALAAGPLPPVLLHGDFHPWNVARAPGWVDGEEVIIDWTDAAVGVAGADLVTLLRPDVAHHSRAGVVDAYARVWADALGASLATCRSAVDAAIVAGHVVQALAFDGILRTVDPATRWQNAGALADNLRALIAAEPG